MDLKSIHLLIPMKINIHGAKENNLKNLNVVF